MLRVVCIVKLEGSASDIWEKLIEEKSFKEIYHWMAETYEADPEQMKLDLEEFVDDLISKIA